VSALIDGVTDPGEIADLFANKCDDLYSCVGYDKSDMSLCVCFNAFMRAACTILY